MNKKNELIDLVDSNGVVQQQFISRSEAASYPDLHLQIVIGVIFDKIGRVLVHKRAQSKKVNPGHIDHVCGAVISGETIEEAVKREALEETGLCPDNLQMITHGINKYNRYRYLMAEETGSNPGKVDPTEVEWVQFLHIDELKAKLSTGVFPFVEDFFEDMALALEAKKKEY